MGAATDDTHVIRTNTHARYRIRRDPGSNVLAVKCQMYNARVVQKHNFPLLLVYLVNDMTNQISIVCRLLFIAAWTSYWPVHGRGIQYLVGRLLCVHARLMHPLGLAAFRHHVLELGVFVCDRWSDIRYHPKFRSRRIKNKLAVKRDLSAGTLPLDSSTIAAAVRRVTGSHPSRGSVEHTLPASSPGLQS